MNQNKLTWYDGSMCMLSVTEQTAKWDGFNRLCDDTARSVTDIASVEPVAGDRWGTEEGKVFEWGKEKVFTEFAEQ